MDQPLDTAKIENRRNMIHLVFNLDNGYVPHCAATIASVEKARRGTEPLHFHLLCLNVSEQNKRMLFLFVQELGFEISFYDVDETLVKHLPNLCDQHHISAATYLRLFLQDYLPAHVDKVVYLDCDVIVRKSIDALWKTDVEGVALAAVQDIPVFDHQQRLQMEAHSEYFNAGVMVVNLAYWRSHHAKPRFMDCMGKQKDKIVFHDQDVLNLVFAEEKRIISPEWNVMELVYTQPKLIPPAYWLQVSPYGSDPAIVHFTGGLKPWDCWLNHPFQKDYFSSLDRTPWKGRRPTLRSVVKKRGWLRALANLSGLEFLFKRLLGQ